MFELPCAWLPMFGQLCVGFADGDVDGVVAVVDVDADGVPLCVAATATVAAPAPTPPARSAVTTARRSSTPLSDGIQASLPQRAAIRPSVQ